jgi:hypothetical protein
VSDIGEMPAGARVNAELVRLLESALSDAKAGRLVAGGVVAVIGPSSFVAFAAMSAFPGEIIAGAEVMKADVILKMRQPRQSPIVRPGQMQRMNGGH